MNDNDVKQPTLLNLSKHIDGRGELIFGEIGQDWDFPIKRIYFSTNFDKGTIRGGHAHKELDQVIVNISGSFSIHTDCGNNQKASWKLEAPGQALRLHSPIWREVESHSNSAVFITLASEVYDEDDYIRDYNTFKTYVERK